MLLLATFILGCQNGSIAEDVARLVKPLAVAQDTFADLPRNHWAIEAIRRLKKNGLVLDNLAGLSSYDRPSSRYRLAALVHIGYSNLEILVEEIRSRTPKATFMLNGGGRNEAERFAKSSADEISGVVISSELALQRLTSEFSPELAKLGADPEEMHLGICLACQQIFAGKVDRLDSPLVQFPDVSFDHWAAKSVLELRKLGILQGYPDGKFAASKLN